MKKRQLLMGNEAIARGAVEAGIKVATAYPGTPSSEVFATLARFAREYGYYAEWSVNEKVALEVAAGAAYAGARAITSMKQVGLNVAADPLMTLAYIGVKGGLVVVVADDPGPHSSQNEQDTRLFARLAKLPVFDPATPQEAKDMAKAAFDLSEKFRLPVILRPTTRVCHVCQDVEIDEVVPLQREYVFHKSPEWVIFPSLAYEKHKHLNRLQQEIADYFGQLPFNRLELKGRVGVVAAGVSYNYVREALADLEEEDISLLKIGTPYPLPEGPVLRLLAQVDRVLVVEEQEPVVEEQLIRIAWRHGLKVEIKGKYDGLVPREGELNVDKVRAALAAFLGREISAATPPAGPPLPRRAPILCAGCPHRASFLAVKEVLVDTPAVLAGDIGCYTLGYAPPLNAMDTCLCMGASVTIASGLARVEKGVKHLAFLGDSTFFHTGLAGLVNAVYNCTDITLVVLDNKTTAMTGHQPHPGLPCTATGEGKAIDIAAVCRAIGVEVVREVNPFCFREAIAAVKEAVNHPGPAVVIMSAPCVALFKPEKLCVVTEECTGCRQCVDVLGCPALVPREERMTIEEKCTGCGLCREVCPVGAIEEVAR